MSRAVLWVAIMLACYRVTPRIETLLSFNPDVHYEKMLARLRGSNLVLTVPQLCTNLKCDSL